MQRRETKEPVVRRSRLERSEKAVAMIANVFVIAGILIAVIQLCQSRQTERTQNAINTINLTRSSEFLKAFARLKTAVETQTVLDKVGLIDDLNFVMNTYDNMALLYINDVADRCVLKNAIHPSLREIVDISDAFLYPKGSRQNVDKVLELMRNEAC